MHLLSFLGTGNYDEVRYELDGRIAAPSRFPQLALCELLKPDRLTVMVTGDARARNGDKLEQALEQAIPGRWRFNDIPVGRSEAECWQIFDSIVQAAEGDSEVVLDMTHGFRSLPMIGLLSSVYLDVTGSARLARLLYGAFEATDRETTPPVTPFFDLSPFLEMIQWFSAGDAFFKTGQGQAFGELLRQRHGRAYSGRSRQAGEGEPDELLPKHLQKIGKSLATAADSAILLRRSHMDSALEDFDRHVAGGKAGEELSRHTPAFSAILDKLKASLEPLRLHGEGDLAVLEREFRQVEWLNQRGHVAAAMTLLREWMVSRFGLLLDDHLPENEERERVENLLNQMVEASRKTGSEPTFSPAGAFPPMEEINVSPKTRKEWAGSWSALRELRNDLNHAGYRSNSTDARCIRKQGGKLIEDCRRLFPGPE